MNLVFLIYSKQEQILKLFKANKHEKATKKYFTYD